MSTISRALLPGIPRSFRPDRPLTTSTPGSTQPNQYARFLYGCDPIDGAVGIKYVLSDSIKLGAGVAASLEDIVWVNGFIGLYPSAYWAEDIGGIPLVSATSGRGSA